MKKRSKFSEAEQINLFLKYNLQTFIEFFQGLYQLITPKIELHRVPAKVPCLLQRETIVTGLNLAG